MRTTQALPMRINLFLASSFVALLVFSVCGSRQAQAATPSAETGATSTPQTAKIVTDDGGTLVAPALYELGIGLGAAYFPHYPGANQSKLYIMPFPFAIVRGRVLQSDRRGMRARLFTGKSFDISMSGAGAFPVKSGENKAREGMQDLGWIGQGGPKLRYEVTTFEDGGLLRLGFSVRMVVASRKIFEIDHRGTVFEPELVYTRPNTFSDQTDLYASLRTSFATRGLMSYYYHVGASEATASRAAYDAQPGLLETTATFGLNIRSANNQHRWFVSTDLETIEGARNVDSPLVKSKWNASVALAYIWTFYESKEKASVVY
ncbi:MAG: MipA/OmpV family protein [Proteobacteria bacterium]|nr:MAG: MipA/OmpV family protein [Pseudomonadota bacterium]